MYWEVPSVDGLFFAGRQGWVALGGARPIFIPDALTTVPGLILPLGTRVEKSPRPIPDRSRPEPGLGPHPEGVGQGVGSARLGGGFQHRNRTLKKVFFKGVMYT